MSGLANSSVIPSWNTIYAHDNLQFKHRVTLNEFEDSLYAAITFKSSFKYLPDNGIRRKLALFIQEINLFEQLVSSHAYPIEQTVVKILSWCILLRCVVFPFHI